MFPKLYKYLEEMNDSLRQQVTGISDARQLAEKNSERLESVNDSMVVQNKLLATQNALSKEVLSQSRRGLAPVLQLVNLLLCCIGIVVIIVFSYYTFELSNVTRRLVNSSSAPAFQTSSSIRQDGRLSETTEGAAERQVRIERQAGMQAHLAKLDSLISEQAQSIRELKKLNTISVRTFTHIRRHLDLADGR